MVESEKVSFSQDQVLAYLKGLEKSEGGFSFAPTVPPGIKDTYYATQTFRLLGEESLPTKATVEWIAQEPFHPEAPLATLACQAELCSMFEIPLPINLLSKIIEKEFNKNLSTRRLWHLSVLAKLTGITELERKVEIELARLNPLPNPSDTLETLVYKFILVKDKPQNWDRKIEEWISTCRNGDGGYGCRPNTTSFLEHLYWATRLMESAGLSLSDSEREESVQFVLGSQSKRGGFGRAPEGVPFIDSTYQAVWTLNFLKVIEL